MADYKIQIGTILDTKGIDTGINKYHQKKSIEFKSSLDTSGIDKKITGYKAKKPIEINSKLNTKGISDKIREFKPKTPININAKLNRNSLNTSIMDFKTKAYISVNARLNKDGISDDIKKCAQKTPIKINATLDKKVLNAQIRDYKSPTIKIKTQLTKKSIDDVIKGYKSPDIKLNVSLKKGDINKQIKDFKPRTTIYLKAALKKGAIAQEIRDYKPSTPVAVMADFKVGNTQNLDAKIASYKNTPVEVPVKLIPAKTGFSDKITTTPVKVSATVDKDDIRNDIEAAVGGYTPTAKMPVNIELTMPKDINSQVKGLGKPTEPLSVDIDLNEEGINSAITRFNPTAKLAVKPDLILEDVDDQIRTYVPQAKVKVNVDLDNSDISGQSGTQNTQSPITVNVKLNREKLNEQIRNFKTDTKIKVGVKLDFASHKNGQSGVPQQIKDYKTNAKIKVGVQLDPNDIAQQIGNINTNTPIILGVELDPNGVQNVQNQINTLRQQIQNLGNVNINLGGNGNGGGNGGRGIGNVDSVFQRASRSVYNLYKQIEDMELKLRKLGMSGIDSGNITQYRNQLDQLRQTYENLLATLNGQNGTINLDNVLAEVDQARTSITELSSQVDNARTKLARDIKINIDNGSLQGKINDVEQKFRKLGITNQQVTGDIRELQRLLGNMDASDDIESVTSDYQTFLQLLQRVNNGVNGLQAQINDANRPEILETAREAAMQRLNGLFEDGSQAAKVYGSRAQQLRNELNRVGNAKGIEIVNNKIKNLGTEIKNSGLQVKTFGTRLKEQFSRYSNYLSIATVFMYATRALRSMFEQVKAIDSAMTELKKVTNETDESYNKFLSNAATRAKEIGTTIDGLVSSTADFARLGYGFEDSQKLAEVANIYAVVGDEIEGVEGATQSLISTLAAFKDEASGISDADFAMEIIDIFNELGNKFAISSGGLGEALERSASSLEAANNTIHESAALITAANEVVQNPEKVGKLAMPTQKMAISVKGWRQLRPRKDFISIFDAHQLGRVCVFFVQF